MAFKDEPIKKEVCLPKQINPLIDCRCANMYKALDDVEFSLAGAQCMQVVLDEVCKFCTKKNGR